MTDRITFPHFKPVGWYGPDGVLHYFKGVLGSRTMNKAVALKITYNIPIGRYEQAIEELGMAEGVHDAGGAISHWVEETPQGFIVHDVWERREDFDRFVEERLSKIDMPPPDEVQETPVYNYLVGT